MPGPDPTHWLHRLTPDEWLAAAETELGHCEQALLRRAVRPGVTHARRGAGMALNAILAASPGDPEARWGRSYMEHVARLESDDTAPDDLRGAARDLKETPAAPPELVTLGRPNLHVLDSAKRILAWARGQTAVLQAPPS